jgi:hypothetical protein
MVPHSRRRRIRQSANILGNRCVRRRWEWGTMVAAVGQLDHNVSTDVVGLLWVVSYVGTRRVTYLGLSDKVTMSIPSGIGAVGSAASSPIRLLCCVVQEGSLWGKDAWWQWRQNKRKKSGRRWFLQHAGLISIDDGGRRHPMAAMGLHSWLLSIQQSTNILWKSSTSLKLEKTIINNVYSLY